MSDFKKNKCCNTTDVIMLCPNVRECSLKGQHFILKICNPMIPYTCKNITR